MIRLPSRGGMLGDASFAVCPSGQTMGIDYDAPPRAGNSIVEQRWACMSQWCPDPSAPDRKINVRFKGQQWCMTDADVTAGKTPCEAGIGAGNSACIDNTSRNALIGGGLVVAAGIAYLIYRSAR